MSAQAVASFRLKRPEEIEKMRVSGRILGACLAQRGTTKGGQQRGAMEDGEREIQEK